MKILRAGLAKEDEFDFDIDEPDEDWMRVEMISECAYCDSAFQYEFHEIPDKELHADRRLEWIMDCPVCGQMNEYVDFIDRLLYDSDPLDEIVEKPLPWWEKYNPWCWFWRHYETTAGQW